MGSTLDLTQPRCLWAGSHTPLGGVDPPQDLTVRVATNSNRINNLQPTQKWVARVGRRCGSWVAVR